MRSSELREIEKARAAERPAPNRRVMHRDVKPSKGWNEKTLAGMVDAELRASGVRKIFREERSR